MRKMQNLGKTIEIVVEVTHVEELLFGEIFA
jgi:hypothetical protein